MPTHRLTAIAGVTLPLLLTSEPAAAQGTTRALRWDPAVDTTVTLGGAAVWVTSEVLKPELAPSRCRWCDVDPMDARVRDALVWRETATADAISNFTGFVLMPLAAVGLDAVAAAHEGALGSVGEDSLLMAEAWVVAAGATQLTKMLVGRERPFVHALPPEEKPRTALPSDNNLSFFSGHTSSVFALTVAAGTIGTMHGYRWAPLAWGGGGAVAVTTGYLRIAADKHWLTDVLAGAVVGAGIGFAVPFFFHAPVASPSTGSTSSGLRLPALPAVMFVW